MEDGLVWGMRKMAMQTPVKAAGPAKRPSQVAMMDQGAVSESVVRHETRDKISGLESYDGSSDASGAMQEDVKEHLTGFQERLRAAKAKSGGEAAGSQVTHEKPRCA
jgi:hypothetical protein